MNSGLNTRNPTLVAAFRNAVHLGTFADSRLGASGWTPAQTIQVMIPYGSSG